MCHFGVRTLKAWSFLYLLLSSFFVSGGTILEQPVGILGMPDQQEEAGSLETWQSRDMIPAQTLK